MRWPQASGLLAGLGGFAITVLAVMLGLEALDSQRSSRAHVAAQASVLRHVSLSLAVASVICLMGALILSEVSAQASSVEKAHAKTISEVALHLDALGLSPSRVAQELISIGAEPGGFFESVGSVSLMAHRLAQDPNLADQPRFRYWKGGLKPSI